MVKYCNCVQYHREDGIIIKTILRTRFQKYDFREENLTFYLMTNSAVTRHSIFIQFYDTILYNVDNSRALRLKTPYVFLNTILFHSGLRFNNRYQIRYLKIRKISWSLEIARLTV